MVRDPQEMGASLHVGLEDCESKSTFLVVRERKWEGEVGPLKKVCP